MFITKNQEKEIKNELVDEGLYYCNRCENFFIVRNICDGEINGRICPCCGVAGEDVIEEVEVEE